MGKLSDSTDENIIQLIWGPPKSGKTVLASQYPQPFFICLETGLMSVRGMVKAAKVDVDFDVILIDDSPTTDPDFLAMVSKLDANKDAWTKTKAIMKAACEKLPRDRTIVFDNLSRASEYLLSHIRKVTSREKLEIQDWMTFTNEMVKLLEPMKSAKANIVLIAHEQYDKDDVTGDVVKSILMPSKTKHRIPSIVSDFLYLSAAPTGPKVNIKIKRLLQTVPNQMVPTGSRCLIPNIEDPTYEKIRPYITTALGRDPGPASWTPGETN